MKEAPTNSGKTYSVHTANGCTVSDDSGWSKAIDAPDGYFTAHGSSVYLSDDEATMREVFKLAPQQKLSLLGVLGGNAGLPAGYKRVEWLESTNWSYIDTGVNVTSDLKVSLDCYLLNTQTMCPLFGNEKINTDTFLVWWGTSGSGPSPGTFRFDYGKSGAWMHVFGNSSGRYLVTKDGRKNYLNGILVATNAEAEINGGHCLMGGSGDNWGNSKGIKFYAFCLESSVKMQMLPALDPTGAPCMFDLVSKTAFYNAGTADFLYPGKETEVSTYSLRRPVTYAQLTEHGVRRLYRVPNGYNGTKEEYAAENGFKPLVETPQPEEGYWSPQWRETEEEIVLEWVETEPPTDEFGLPAEPLTNN